MHTPLPWMDFAFLDLGVKEVPGSGDNPTILEYYKQAGKPEFTKDSVPWCAVFVGAKLKLAGLKGTGSALARSYQKWGVPAPGPIYGAICVMSRGSPSSGSGHVGFVTGYDAKRKRVKLLGGNQNDEVNESWYGVNRVLAYRWHAGVDLPNDDSDNDDDDGGEVAVAHERTHVTSRPIVASYEETKAALKENGSRIVTSSEKIETTTKTTLGAGGLFLFFQNYWNQVLEALPFLRYLEPLVTVLAPLWPFAAAALLIYILNLCNVIKFSRVDDERTGKTRSLEE